MSTASAGLRSLDATLVRVVLLMRGLGWLWLMVLGVVTIETKKGTVDEALIVASMVVATVGAALTLLAARRGFLDKPLYVVFDGIVSILLALVGPIAGVGDFIAGGYPASWLFIVAYSSNVRVTAAVGAAAGFVFAGMHVFLAMPAHRAYGSMQYLVIAVIVGWGFDTLRRQETLRLAAEADRSAAEAELAGERARAVRLEERSRIAVDLHDSVLQTLKLIRSSSGNAAEVRYLARAQERDLRRTISEYESPFAVSFRTQMLETQADIEDLYRVEIDQVIKDDAEMDPGLETLVAVAREVMSAAVRDDGARRVDVFTVLTPTEASISIRTSPSSGTAPPLAGHVADRLEKARGRLTTRKAPGDSLEVGVAVPR